MYYDLLSVYVYLNKKWLHATLLYERAIYHPLRIFK